MKKVPCGGCGELRWPSQHQGAPKVPTCRKCRSEAFTHGTTNGYKRHGCRCDECREAQAAAQRDYQASRRARGLPTRQIRPGDYRRYSMSQEKRLAIFERDEWTCQICELPLDLLAHWNDPMSPTLDHIEPQSLALIPDHSPDNLRAAHRRCNASRGNRVEMEQAC